MLQIFIVKLAYIFQYVHYVKCKDEENVLLKRYLKINLIKDERDPPESPEFWWEAPWMNLALSEEARKRKRGKTSRFRFRGNNYDP